MKLNLPRKPQIGEIFTAYFSSTFGKILLSSKVVEWRNNKCFFENGYYLVWNSVNGFML